MVDTIAQKWKINSCVHGEEQYTEQLENIEHTKQKVKRTKQENKHETNDGK
jgi:hypothetical protein